MNRNMPWRSPITIVLVILCVAFLGMGLRTFVLPGSAAAYFGVPTDASDALAFVKAYGARNIAISLTAMALLWLDARQGLAMLLACAALVALLDASILYGRDGLTGAARHLAYVAVLLTLSLVTFTTDPRRSTRTTGR